MKRRTFIKMSAAGVICLSSMKIQLARAATATNNILVNVFLRGAADGLNMVVPAGDSNYFNARPTIAVNNGVNLDGFFSLNPAAQSLYPFWQTGQLAAIQATGVKNNSRSHFKMQSLMERGIVSEAAADQSGWLGRYMQANNGASSDIFRGIGIGKAVQRSLSGPVSAIGIGTIEDFGLDENGRYGAERKQKLSALFDQFYGAGDDAIDEQANNALSAIDILAQSNPGQYASTVVYPADSFANDLKMLAQLIKAGLNIETVSLDIGGWDHHADLTPRMDERLKTLSDSLAAFMNDTTAYSDRITVVCMSEFGRRLQENASLGTDHGRGGLMLALGAGVVGGMVYGSWPGLASGQLNRGDLEITTDYRTVLVELITRRFASINSTTIFPDYVPEAPLGVFV